MNGIGPYGRSSSLTSNDGLDSSKMNGDVFTKRQSILN